MKRSPLTRYRPKGAYTLAGKEIRGLGSSDEIDGPPRGGAREGGCPPIFRFRGGARGGALPQKFSAPSAPVKKINNLKMFSDYSLVFSCAAGENFGILCFGNAFSVHFLCLGTLKWYG